MKTLLAFLLLLTPAASARVPHFPPTLPELLPKLLQPALRPGTQLQLARKPLSQNANQLVDTPLLRHAQEGCGSFGIHTALGHFLVTEPLPPYKSGQAEAE